MSTAVGASRRRLRVGIDARSAIGQHARGEGKCLIQLYQEIAKLRPEWQLLFFGTGPLSGGDKLKQAIPNAEVCCFELPGFRWNSWENIGLPALAARHRLDVLHSFSSGAPRWALTPVVMTVHDIIPLIADDGLSPAEIERFRRRLSAGLRSARHVVTVSDNTRQDLLKAFDRLAPERCSVIPWAGPKLQPELLAQKLRRWETAFDQGHVLALGGGGSKRKNMPGVIAMFAQVLAQRPTAKLRLIGVTSTAEREAITAQTSNLGIAGKVEISGYVSEQELEAAYLNANCLVYISTYEGFGLPPLEAMARGVPVVASSTSSIPEVVGDAAVTVDPADTPAIAAAVLALLSDHPRCIELLHRGQQRALMFSWQRSAESMIKVLESAAP
jgi:alpha-1,3-rhamnosyl/mannosyltransferase